MADKDKVKQVVTGESFEILQSKVESLFRTMTELKKAVGNNEISLSEFHKVNEVQKKTSDSNTKLKRDIEDLKISLKTNSTRCDKLENENGKRDTRVSMDNSQINMEIEKLKEEKAANKREIRDIESKLASLNKEQGQIREAINLQSSSCEKLQHEVEEFTKIVSSHSKSKGNEIERHSCKMCSFTSSKKADIRSHIKLQHPRKLVCRICECQFDENHTLEQHLEIAHVKVPNFSCDMCGKKFILKWRFLKHVQSHHQSNVRFCYYYNNRKECPFSQIGCKFQHKEAPECKFKEECNKTMCQFKHS